MWRFGAEDITLSSALVPLTKILARIAPSSILRSSTVNFIYVLCLTMLRCTLGDISLCLRHSDMLLYGCITVSGVVVSIMGVLSLLTYRFIKSLMQPLDVC